MYDYIKGKLADKKIDSLVIEAGGVGYLVFASSKTIKAFPEIGETVKVLTKPIVREDSWQLFGFKDSQERTFFEMLISVSGVGPKAAMALLSSFTPDQLSKAIAGNDDKLLSSAPGIGRKTASRMIVELKEKLGDTQIPGELLEARDALLSLGYSFNEASELLKDIEEGSTEEIIKKALSKTLNG